MQRLVKRSKEFTVKLEAEDDPDDRTSEAGHVTMDGNLAGKVIAAGAEP